MAAATEVAGEVEVAWEVEEQLEAGLAVAAWVAQAAQGAGRSARLRARAAAVQVEENAVAAEVALVEMAGAAEGRVVGAKAGVAAVGRGWWRERWGRGHEWNARGSLWWRHWRRR